MNKETLARMSEAELDEYGKLLGIAMKAAKDAESKAALIERRRAKVAKVRVLGLDLEIPVKRLSDKRVTDLLGADSTDETQVEAMRLILGNEQFDKVVAACTEDDGTIDIYAMGLCFSKIITNQKLKNF